MSRAAQFEVLLAGIRNPTTNAPLSGGSVSFYAAGTETPKAAYTDETRTTPIYTKSLDAAGRAFVFGDGIYKIRVYDASGVLVYTWDGLKVHHYQTQVTYVINDTVLTVDDDVVLVDTTSGDITLALPPAATWTHPIVVKKVTSDSNTITLDPSGAELIDGAATVSFSAPGYAFTVVSGGASLYGATPNPNYLAKTGGTMTGPIEFEDANHSLSKVEGPSGEDVLQVKGGGAEAWVLGKNNSYIGGNAEYAGGQWNRIDITKGACLVGATHNFGPVAFGVLPGANPITWSGPYPLIMGFHGRIDGAGAAVKLPTGWSSTRLSQGNYRITHTIGHDDFSVSPGSSQFIVAHTITSTTFDLSTYNAGMSAIDAACHFILALD